MGMLKESLKKHIHREIANATVKILEKVDEAYEFRGSGFFITENGYLLTAYHCVEEIPSDDIFIETRFDGKFKAVLEEQKSLRDIQYDIAVLKVNYRPSHCLPLGTVSVQNVADEIVAVGYPAGHKPENTQIGTYIGKISRFRTDKKIENNAIKGQGQSGGLIYHYATQRVIGLAVRGYKTDVMLDTGLATRFEPLFEKWYEFEIINDKVAKNWEEHLAQFRQLKKISVNQNTTQHTTSNDLTIDDKWLIVNALLKCPSMQTGKNRDTVLSCLRNSIFHAITRYDNNSFDIFNIVNTCLNYDGGIAELVTVLDRFDGNTIPMQELKTLLERQ